MERIIMDFISNPIFISFAMSLIVTGLAFAEAKMKELEREKETYLKLFVGTFLCVNLVLYLLKPKEKKEIHYDRKPLDRNFIPRVNRSIPKTPKLPATPHPAKHKLPPLNTATPTLEEFRKQ